MQQQRVQQQKLGATAEDAAAGGAAAEQICTLDSSGCSMQLMAAFALACRVWEQNWETIVASDSSEGADVSSQSWKYGAALQKLQNEKSRVMVSCEEALHCVTMACVSVLRVCCVHIGCSDSLYHLC